MTHRVITAPLRWGLRENLPQFLLLVAVNALVGATLGQERTVLPLLAAEEFGLDHYSGALTYILAFGLAWGIFPVLFVTAGLPLGQVGVLAAVYPTAWGAAQLGTGALSDRWGRKGLIVTGMLTQALALVLIAAGSNFPSWLGAMALLGLGTAMVYPTLLAGIGDVAHPSWRARAVGVYRLWRDGGFAVGALVSGITADALGLEAAIVIVAALTAGSGVVVAVRMRRNDHASRPQYCIPPGVPDTLGGIGRALLHTTSLRRNDASRTHL